MEIIYSYLLSKDGQRYLAKNFRVKEFASHDGSDFIFVAQRLPAVLQYIRQRLNADCRHAGEREIPLYVNSGYRTAAHNTQEGGVAASQHCRGTAADIYAPGISGKILAQYAREIMPDWGGVGIYGSWAHIDVREEKADWTG